MEPFAIIALARAREPGRDFRIKHRTGSVKPTAGFEHLSGTMTRGIRSLAFLRGERDSLLATLEDSKTRQWRASRIGFNELSGIRSTSDRRTRDFPVEHPPRLVSHCPRIMVHRCTRVLCRLRQLLQRAECIQTKAASRRAGFPRATFPSASKAQTLARGGSPVEITTRN